MKIPKQLRAGAWVAGVALVIALALGAWHTFAPRHTPAGQPPLERLSADSLVRLEKIFNEERHKTRLLVMLSPT